VVEVKLPGSFIGRVVIARRHHYVLEVVPASSPEVGLRASAVGGHHYRGPPMCHRTYTPMSPKVAGGGAVYAIPTSDCFGSWRRHWELYVMNEEGVYQEDLTYEVSGSAGDCGDERGASRVDEHLHRPSVPGVSRLPTFPLAPTPAPTRRLVGIPVPRSS
jgi:hypothetical protein